MNTYILLIPVCSSFDARNVCEEIESTDFRPNKKLYKKDVLSCREILTEISKVIGFEKASHFDCCKITDFMDLCNDNNIDIDNFFISYVYA